VVFGLCGTAAGTPAYAHNALTSSDPSDGAALEQGPGEVRLTFLATIDPDHADLSVTGPDFPLGLAAVGAGGLLVARRGWAGGGLTG
jgi:methionine-rich copper-binding protein CopC